jgi:homeobox protein YOX1/YHP1
MTSGKYSSKDPPAQQQQTHAPYTKYPSYQQLSETRYHSGQTHTGVSYGRASPPSSSADPWRRPPLDVPVGGRVQGQAYYQYHADSQTPHTSNDLRSPHSVYSPASSIPQHQPPASPAYPAGHSPSRGAAPTAAAADTADGLALEFGRISLFDDPIYQHSRRLTYPRAPTAPSPVPYDVPPKTQEPTIKKKRKRADARQLEALNRMHARTAFPSTEERQQLARDLDMSARSVQIWLVHAFVYITCIISELSTFSLRFQNKRQASRQGGRNPANSSISQDTVTLPEDSPPVVIHPRGSPAPMGPMGESSHRSRSPLPAMMRSGQTPSPPSGRSRADMDPRRQWPGRRY